VPDEREKLTRETFQLERDFQYWQFRQHHWDNAEVVATCPDPQEREEMLRGFWNQDAEKRYPEYRAVVSGLSMTELEAEREYWLDRLSLLSDREYKDILAEAAAKTPVNDNEKNAETPSVDLSYDRELFEELRADYAAAKREDAHWYGRETPQDLPPAQPENGYDKMLKQYADAGANHKPQEKDKGQER
jgi:hypothetical protein